MMLEGAGFEVIDLGINTPVEQYLEALEEHQPEILGMSALLTTTMPYMKVVIDTLKEKGSRRLHRARRRRASERGVRDGDRRRRLLPRRRRRRRDRAGARAAHAALRRRSSLSWTGTTELLEIGGRVRRDGASRRAHPRLWRDRPRGARGDRAQRVDARRRALPAGQASLDPGEDRRRRRRQADRAEGPATRASSSPTPTAARAAPSTLCWINTMSSGCRALIATASWRATTRGTRCRRRSSARTT